MYVIICSSCSKEYIEKSFDKLKRDSVFTENTFDNLNMTEQKLKEIYAPVKGEYLIFYFLQNDKN